METNEDGWLIHPTYGQLASVLDTLNAGILVRTVDGKILFANSRMLYWLGYAQQELDGRDARSLLADELLEHVDEELQEIHSGDERLRVTVMKRKDGRTMPVLLCPHVLRRDEEIQAIVTVVLDLGEIQTARRIDGKPASGIVAGLQRIAAELQTISLFAGGAGIGEVSHDHPDIALLSPREREILSELITGIRVPAIAKKLFISPHTVRNHLKSMYRKLDVPHQAALIERVRSISR